MDVRGEGARILGPRVAFHPSETRLLVLHYNGVLYECGFNPDHDTASGSQECGLLQATTWFAVRHDFRVQGSSSQTATVAGGASEEGDDDAEPWQVL